MKNKYKKNKEIFYESKTNWLETWHKVSKVVK